MSLKNIFEEKKALEEKLRELDAATQSQKAVALQQIRTIVDDNCITYKELLGLLNELKLVQASQREMTVKNHRKYYDPVNGRSWDGGYYVPQWVQENIDKLEDWLTTDASGRNHTTMALTLMGKNTGTAAPITVERTYDNNWIGQRAEEFNQLFSENQLDILKEKYTVMNEANQSAILASLHPKVQDYILNDFSF